MSGGDLMEGDLFLAPKTGTALSGATMSQQIWILSLSFVCFLVTTQVLDKFFDVDKCATTAISWTLKHLYKSLEILGGLQVTISSTSYEHIFIIKVL